MPEPPLPEKLQTILANPGPAVMATLRADGAPITVATWYLWEDGRVLVSLDARRKRLAHLRRDPRLSLTVLDEDWYRHVSLHGRAVRIADDPELADIDRISMHYRGRPYPNRERPRVSVWIEIETWFAWGA